MDYLKRVVRGFLAGALVTCVATDCVAAIKTNLVGETEVVLPGIDAPSTNFTEVVPPVVFNGALSDSSPTNTFTFTVSEASKQRVSVDPVLGERIGNGLELVLERKGDDGSWTNRIWEVGNDVGDGATIDFETNRTYRVVITANNTYSYAFGIGLPSVQLSLDTMGGTLGMSESKKPVRTIGYPYGYLPEPTLTNRIFHGWYTDRTAGDLVSVSNLVSSAVTNLYARWRVSTNHCTVVFNANGGTGTMANQIFEVGEAAKPLSSNRFARVDWSFVGWMTKADGKVVYTNAQVVAGTDLTSRTNSTVNLYAKWAYSGILWDYTDADGIVWTFSVSSNGVATIMNIGSDMYAAAISTWTAGAITVPSRVFTNHVAVTVKAIGERAFERCAKVTSVKIPASVEEIGESAFRNCAALKKVTFGSNLAIEAIPARCFSGCTALKSISIPYSVTEIGEFAFAGCKSLSPAIVIPENVDAMGSCVFTNCANLKIVRYCGGEPSEVADDVYAGTSRLLRTGVLKAQRKEWAEDGKLPAEWKSRKTGWWLSDTPTICSVTFKPNGGTGEATRRVVKGHALINLPEEPTAPAYATADGEEADFTFLGWRTKKTGGSAVTERTVIKKSMTAYARWAWDGEDLSEETADDYDSWFFPGESEESAAGEAESPSPGEGGGDEESDSSAEGAFDPINTALANSYVGIILDAEAASLEDIIAGTNQTILGKISVKVAKGKVKSGVTNSMVTATVACNGVRQVFTGVMQNGWTVTLADVYDAEDTMSLTFGADGMSGTWGDNIIQGARNAFGQSKSAGAVKLACYYRRTWKVPVESEIGSTSLTVTFDKKGVATISGKWKGVKFSVKSTLISAEEGAYLPLVFSLPKDGGSLALVLKLPEREYGAYELGGAWVDVHGNAHEVEGSKEGTETVIKDAGRTLVVGVRLSETLSVSGYQFAASGLPPGIKLSKSGKMSGIPTKAGVYHAKITAKSKKGAQSVCATFDVKPLPFWARGAFSGYVSNGDGLPGGMTMNVSSVGKISGKIVLDGKKWTFAAKSYEGEAEDEQDDGAGEEEAGDSTETVSSVPAVFEILTTAKCGKKSKALELSVSEEGVIGVLDDDGDVNLYRHGLFTRDADMKEQLYEVAGAYTVSMEVPDSKVGYGYLSLSVDSKGAVKYAGKMADGMVVSGSTPLLNGDMAPFARLFATPSAYKNGGVFALLDFIVSTNGPTTVVSTNGVWVSAAANAGFARTFQAVGCYYDKLNGMMLYYETNQMFSAVAPTNLDVVVESKTKKKRKLVAHPVTRTISDEVPSDWGKLGVTFEDNGKAIISGKEKGGADMAFSFTRATGVFSGSFCCRDVNGEALKFPFAGVALLGGDVVGLRGYYLLNRMGMTSAKKTYTYRESRPVVFMSERNQ